MSCVTSTTRSSPHARRPPRPCPRTCGCCSGSRACPRARSRGSRTARPADPRASARCTSRQSNEQLGNPCSTKIGSPASGSDAGTSSTHTEPPRRRPVIPALPTHRTSVAAVSAHGREPRTLEIFMRESRRGCGASNEQGSRRGGRDARRVASHLRLGAVGPHRAAPPRAARGRGAGRRRAPRHPIRPDVDRGRRRVGRGLAADARRTGRARGSSSSSPAWPEPPSASDSPSSRRSSRQSVPTALGAALVPRHRRHASGPSA